MPYEDDYEDPPCECDDCRRSRGEDGEDLEYGAGPASTREAPLSAPVTFAPLRNILRLPGMLWSAEVEVVGMGYVRAARILGCETEGYGYSGGHGEIVATLDATVDAEIKLSRMTDGDSYVASMCSDAYWDLREGGAVADYSCGHHVHIDARRIAEAGEGVALEVITAAAALGAACDRTLTALASTGYREHREDSGNNYGGDWCLTPSILGDRYKLHGSRTGYAISYGNPSYATVEYRLPNGTLYAERAHAHVALAGGLVDLASRAVLDRCPSASEAVGLAFDRLQGWRNPYSDPLTPPCYGEADGAAFLSRYLHLHPDSFRALSLAAKDSPASKQHADVWRIAATSRKAV